MPVQAQNFGSARIVKRNPLKALGDEPGFLVTDASDALEVHVMEMPAIVVSVPPVSVNLLVVSVTQGTTPWIIAGDVSVPPITIATVSVTGDVSVLAMPPITIAAVSVTGHVSIDNASTNPVQVTIQSFQTAVSVSGQVSVQNFPAVVSVTQGTSPWAVAGNVSAAVAGNVSATIVGNVSVTPVAGQVFPVSWASTNQVDVTDRALRVLGALTSLAGNVSVVGNVSAAVAGNVSAVVTGNVSVIQNTSPWAVAGNVSAAVAGNVSATVIGNVSVIGQVSVLGNVSVATARVALTPAVPTHASVGTAATQVAASVAGRKGLVLMNKTSINVYLGVNQTAVLGSGMFLAPNGVYEMDEYLFTTGSFGAIASVAGVASLTVQEL